MLSQLALTFNLGVFVAIVPAADAAGASLVFALISGVIVFLFSAMASIPLPVGPWLAVALLAGLAVVAIALCVGLRLRAGIHQRREDQLDFVHTQQERRRRRE